MRFANGTEFAAEAECDLRQRERTMREAQADALAKVELVPYNFYRRDVHWTVLAMPGSPRTKFRPPDIADFHD